jgi:transposase-like zinc-binding protein
MMAWAARFQRYGPADRVKAKDRLLPNPRVALQAIEQCHTAALGGHRSHCPTGGALEDRAHAYLYWHGPTCQTPAATPWRTTQRARLLPASSWLVTLTMSEALRALPLLVPPCAAAFPSRTTSSSATALGEALPAAALLHRCLPPVLPRGATPSAPLAA